jgi:hypothetical protein
VEGRTAPARSDLRDALVITFWMLLFLVAADVAINRLFRQPQDPRSETKGQLKVYFNYGWSIEAKIRRLVGLTDETSGPLVLAGWVDREVESKRKEPNLSPGDLLVSSYGMSFSNQILESVAEMEPKVRLRLFGGPAAPVNHSYATYSQDRGGSSKVVILSVLGSSVQGLATNNGMTWRFEGPAPFTYPKYASRAGKLEAEWPMIRTLEDLRTRLADPAGWDAFVAQLQTTDAFYNGFLFRQSISDKSVLGRMVRRAVAQRWQAARIAEIHGPTGFVEACPVVESLRQIVTAFAADARRDGKVPIALLIEDRGYQDHVSRVLEPDLARDRIPYLSTHTISPDSDPRNFVGDGHFTHEANKKIAQALLEVIRHELPDWKG